VNPGDTVVLHLKNEAAETPAKPHTIAGGCAAAATTPQATNLHFHGLNIPATCHQDDVLMTLVGPGAPAYDYRFQIPAGQPPGLYWYHPHPHGFTEAQVLGGASGALIVNGIELFRPEVTGWPERVLVLRDQLQPGQQLNYMEPEEESDKDASLNFVPVTAPLFTPATIEMKAGQKEFWRVLNAAADTYFDLQLELDLVAVDGAPLLRVIHKRNILIPPGGRAEFLLTPPAPGVKEQLVTGNYDAGPVGEKSPARVLANLRVLEQPFDISRLESIGVEPKRLEYLTALTPSRVRKLYFSEDRQDLVDPSSMPKYFITEEGAEPKMFDMMSNEADITVERGTVEDWIIENRAPEAHTFHIHQLHFQVMERNGRAIGEPMLMDTIDVPYWDQKSPTYPSVRVRMDFRSHSVEGTFVYHCHILEHEDNGMMGRIRVVHAK
jgi:FtsP/CotA-like multicopper oxidase with cupredoxin domain